MIDIFAKVLCLPIFPKQKRKKIRSKLIKCLTDKMVDAGKIYYLNDSLHEEFAQRNKLINKESRILIIAPHPDDEVIGCGGLMAKYASICDCLCINSSGFKRKEDTASFEEIADERIEEFYNVMDSLGIKNRWIFKIFGPPPHFDKMMAKEDEYLSVINFSKYTHIFVPDRFDGHREHQFLTKSFIPKLIQKQGYNNKTLVCFYNVWGTITCPNYFEDISAIQEQKHKSILLYKSRMNVEDNYAKRIAGLNYFYGLFIGTKYAEAYRVETIEEYLSYEDNKNWARYK
ncbi:MAG: PIG-L family deacetylase [Alphaproteobacteria bacterium]